VGQKVHPIGFRLGIIRGWSSNWFAEGREYANFLHEDLRIRRFIKKKLHHAGISRVDIERTGRRVNVTIHTARPGIVIGRGGVEVDALRGDLEKMIASERQDLRINIREIKEPEVDAQLVAENIALQLERRISFRRAMKRAVGTAMRIGVRGIKVECSGRLGGREIARRERQHEGSVPLHTLRADIDFARAEAHTTFGRIGVKVWVFKEFKPIGVLSEEEPVRSGRTGRAGRR